MEIWKMPILDFRESGREGNKPKQKKNPDQTSSIHISIVIHQYQVSCTFSSSATSKCHLSVTVCRLITSEQYKMNTLTFLPVLFVNENISFNASSLILLQYTWYDLLLYFKTVYELTGTIRSKARYQAVFRQQRKSASWQKKSSEWNLLQKLVTWFRMSPNLESYHYIDTLFLWQCLSTVKERKDSPLWALLSNMCGSSFAVFPKTLYAHLSECDGM